MSVLSGRTVLLWKIGLTVAALLLLAFEEWRIRRGHPVPPRARAAVAIVLAALALAAYSNFGRFRGTNRIHTWDTFHYYIGSKFFRELSYTRIYECAAVAEAEGGRLPDPWYFRDLVQGEVVTATETLAHPERCTQHFSAERWAEFKRDVAFFSGRVKPGRWAAINGDHGFNAPPVWTMAGRLLANLAPASERSVGLLITLDPLLLALALGALAWSFGARVATLAAFLMGVNDSSALEWTWGAYLRNDWLAWLVIALCLAHKRWPAAAGACLAYAALLRLFPAVLFLGPAVLAVEAWRRTGRLTPELRRFFLGAALAGACLVAASLAIVGRDAYVQFAAHIARFRDTPLTNHMGLQTLLSWSPSGRVEEVKKLDVMDPWPVWKERRREQFRLVRPLYLGILGLFAALFAWTARRAAPWQAAAMGLCWIPLLAQLTCYYYVFVAALATLAAFRRGRAVDLLLLLMVLGGQLAGLVFWWDDMYTLASVPMVLGALLLPVAWARSNGPAAGGVVDVNVW